MKPRTLQLAVLYFIAALLLLPRVSQAGTIVATYSYTASLYPGRSYTGSLYDSSDAQTPSPELQTFFGPKSGHIHYDPRMIAAAEIALERAHRHSTERCWHSVKDALVDAQVVPTRPTTEFACEAGTELQYKYGFTKLRITSPYSAPVGAVLVYGGPGAGHVEIRTPTGFVSDFVSATPSHRPLLGIYVKKRS
jgi:hypothetical protein